jgi:hypothetical protein
MHIDAKLLKLFLQNFDEAYRSAKLIILSYPRVKHFFPLDGENLQKLDIDSLDKLDAFRVRFCDLQDAIGNKLFRSLLLLEMESIGSNLDILNQIEKRKLISSFDKWQEIRRLRNLFIHDYPDTVEFKAQILTKAFQETYELIHVLKRVINYLENVLKVDLDGYDQLDIH